MVDFGDMLPLLFLFGLALLALAWLSHQVSQRVQWVVYYVTRNIRLATLVLFLLLLPGIFIHEAAHWVTARLLGLKAGKFRVWPKMQGKMVGLGSVSVQRGALWQDSLVGIAPLVVGTAFIAVIANHIFAADRVAAFMLQGRWADGLAGFWSALGSADGAIWAYLLFAVANAMMPSSSDREPLKPLLLYLAGTVALYLILGFPIGPFAEALAWLTPTLEIVTSALLFTAMLDLLILAVLWSVELLVSPPRRVAPARGRSRR
jgi:hypothetical protein